MRSWILVLVLLTPLLLVPTGCGGGGGAPAPTTDAFVGTYGMAQIGGWFGPPLTGTALWGELWPDGAGTLTGGLVAAIQNGTLFPPSAYASTSYRLLAGNRMEWWDSLGVHAEGGLSADGRLGTMALVRSGGSAKIRLLARRESGFSADSLDGTYHYAHFVTSPTGTGDGTIWGSVAFDGSGTANFTLWTNIDGTVGGPTAVSGSYAVAPNGELTLTVSPTTVFNGTIIRGGDVGIFSGSTVAGGAAAMGVFLKYSTAASDATLNGTYHMTGFTASRVLAPPTNWVAATGTMSADAAGTLTQTRLTRIDDHGVVTTPAGPFAPVLYMVAPNGGINVSGLAVGAVTSDGSVAAIVGGTLADSDLLLWILIR